MVVDHPPVPAAGPAPAQLRAAGEADHVRPPGPALDGGQRDGAARPAADLDAVPAPGQGQRAGRFRPGGRHRPPACSMKAAMGSTLEVTWGSPMSRPRGRNRSFRATASATAPRQARMWALRAVRLTPLVGLVEV